MKDRRLPMSKNKFDARRGAVIADLAMLSKSPAPTG
jgi:hypothetical protein